MISTVSAVGWGSKFSNKIFPVKPHHSRRGARLQQAVQRKEATGSSAVHGVSLIGRNGQSEGVLEYSAIASYRLKHLIFRYRLKHLIYNCLIIYHVLFLWNGENFGKYLSPSELMSATLTTSLI
jgi:hypothetical protein